MVAFAALVGVVGIVYAIHSFFVRQRDDMVLKTPIETRLGHRGGGRIVVLEEMLAQEERWLEARQAADAARAE